MESDVLYVSKVSVDNLLDIEVGDWLVSINGERAASIPILNKKIRNALSQGKRDIKLEILRNGHALTLILNHEIPLFSIHTATRSTVNGTVPTQVHTVYQSETDHSVNKDNLIKFSYAFIVVFYVIFFVVEQPIFRTLSLVAAITLLFMLNSGHYFDAISKSHVGNLSNILVVNLILFSPLIGLEQYIYFKGQSINPLDFRAMMELLELLKTFMMFYGKLLELGGFPSIIFYSVAGWTVYKTMTGFNKFSNNESL